MDKIGEEEEDKAGIEEICVGKAGTEIQQAFCKSS
jgi:hypothetical protein